jgi:Spy/CpxP family protein refolding chaperone
MASNKARVEAAALVFVVFLLGALLGGLGDHLWNERVSGQQIVNPSGMPPRGQVMSDLTRELQLTSDQQQQLGVIIADTRSKWQTLYAPLDAPREQIRQEGRAHIRAILTPEQQLKFDDFLRHLDESRKKDAGH